MKKLFLPFLFIILLSCDKENDPKNLLTGNGFVIGNEFYPTPNAYYANSGSANEHDFAFWFTDKQMFIGDNGMINIHANEDEPMTIFGFVDMTLVGENEFTGDYFYDETESLPRGIDSFGYIANNTTKSQSNQVKAQSGTVKVKSKSGNHFDIEYEASFSNGVNIKGQYKGEIQFLE